MHLCSKWPAQVSIEKNNRNSRDTSDGVVRMLGKAGEQGGHEGVQWKRLVNIICFIDLTVKPCRLSFMLLWLAPLKIQRPQIKNDFLKNLSIFIYFFKFLSPAYELRFCIHYCCYGFIHFVIFMCSLSQRHQWHWGGWDCRLQDHSGLL